VNTVQWVGAASGEWQDANAWKNITTNVTGDATTILGARNGNEGMNNVSPAAYAAKNIVIGGGANVDYNWLTGNVAGTGSDFRLRQGANLTIKEGAVWDQDASALPENGWTRFDPSNLILDNGTFRRSNVSLAGDGGGILMIGSFNDDNNLARLGAPPKINIDIKNGGKLENNGQVWFGADDEHSVGIRGKVTMNGGSMDLTGGTIPLTNSTLAVDADLAFFYDYSESLAKPKNEEWEINFTGPGSIIVDSAGINVYRQDEFSIWTGGDAISYQDLWNEGILKANGLSGKTGSVFGGGGAVALQPANFNDFFTVSGTVGADNYTLTSITAPIATVEWVGAASGEWQDANAWKNTTTNAIGDATTILGARNGNEGMNNVSPAAYAAKNIVIGGGATVAFNWLTGNVAGTGSDFRLRQGANLTIKGGATWVQDASALPENGWTRFDPSNLILDGGSFKRTNQSLAGDGGGILMIGSFNDDNNLARLGAPPKINIEIKNGGNLENNGQVWFGADDEHSVGLRISISINDGDMDLTGGTIPLTNSTLAVDADLAFFYDYSESLAQPKNEEFEINFTGPGSITVDSAGINVYRQDEFSIWTGGDAISYQDLWNEGILKANGLSGKTGSVFGGGGAVALQPANFNDFFTVTGTPGTDNYILNSLIAAAVVGVTGDYNGNGVVDAADYVVWRNGDSPDDTVAGYNLWRANFGNTSGSGSGAGAVAAAGVPEPSSVALLVFGALGLLASARKRQR
jgi:hypothetical protein